MSQLAAAARTHYRHCYQCKRAQGFYDRGVYVRLTPDLTCHRGNFQPAAQKDIQRLPEGSRADGAVTLYSDVEHKTAEAPNQVADRILYNGTEYEVSTAEYWSSHNRYILTKVGQ